MEEKLKLIKDKLYSGEEISIDEIKWMLDQLEIVNEMLIAYMSPVIEK